MKTTLYDFTLTMFELENFLDEFYSEKVIWARDFYLLMMKLWKERELRDGDMIGFSKNFVI